MTDDFGSRGFQSAGSASDDEIGDELALEHGVADDGDVAPGLPVAPSPRPRARHSRPRGTDFNLPEFPPQPYDHPTDRYGVAGGVPTDSSAGAGQAASESRPRRSDRHRKKATGPRRKAPWWELPLLVAVAIVIAILVKTFVIQPFYIPSESMEKTLHGSAQFGHDRILVNKTIYDLRDPHPGDIVVFHAPPGWNEPTTSPPSNPVLKVIRGFGQLVGFVPPDGMVLVKRVIAVGGQTVKGVAVDGGNKEQIMVSDSGPNGPWRTLNEPYVYFSGSDITASFAPVTVPKGRLWVMGDHRNDSADSRYHCPDRVTSTGTCDPMSSTVPVKDVIGKAIVVAWPPSHWRTLGTPSTFKHAAAALPGAMGGAAGIAAVLPLWLVRRRRRRRAA